MGHGPPRLTACAMGQPRRWLRLSLSLASTFAVMRKCSALVWECPGEKHTMNLAAVAQGLLCSALLSSPLALASVPALAATVTSEDGDVARDEALSSLMKSAFPAGRPPVNVHGSGSREAFLDLLSSDLFLHAAIGPFDVFVMKADALASEAEARKVLTQATAGLEPAVRVMRRYFGGEAGLVSGRRFPIALASSDGSDSQPAFAQLVALLDWAEDDYTAWKPAGNAVWDMELLQAETVRTWEVQLFNLAHETVAGHGSSFFEHGLGYYSLAHVAARVLRQGSWGLVPPWLAQGLIDELDIAAYGEAWVGGDWWERQTEGWFRPGWSGFVPQGSSPPPPVTGPPANLAVTVSKTGDSWQHRANSRTRHWTELVADGDSEAPASFLFMAEHESFLPRDRAYARCLLHLLMEIAPSQQGLLSEQLDRIPSTPPSGMPDADPITVVLNRLLGGVPEVDALEAMPLRELIQVIERPEIGAQIEALGGEALLDLADHRLQADWLFRQSPEDLEWDTRNELWRLILEAEYYQQLHEWKPLGKALDLAARAAFEASPGYPTRDSSRKRAGQAFWSALAR